MHRFKIILKTAGLILLVVIVLAGGVYAILPKGPREQMDFADPWNQPRPGIEAQEYAAVTGTPWATQAALDVLDRGGNAFDAAVAALLVLNVTHDEASSFPGIAPLVLYDAQRDQVLSYIGAGTAPAAATIEKFQSKGYKTVPEMNIWSQLLPASPDVVVALLSRYGTLSFAELAEPAIRIAREGYPVHEIMARNLDLSLVERLGFSVILPYNTEVYLRGEWWRPLHRKDRMVMPDLAGSLQGMAGAERAVLQAGGSREDGLQAVRDYFYKGPLAEAITAMHEKQGGFFTIEDLAGYAGGWEEPLQGSYNEYTFYTNQTWSQGIVVPLAMQALEGIDLKSLGHNTPAYIHTVNQAIELAMADREAYAADPAFVDVPVEILLSKDFAAQRRAQMTGQAFGPLPAPGQIPGLISSTVTSNPPAEPQSPLEAYFSDLPFGKDTSQLTIVDRWGNAIAMTPSDFPKTPMVPGTGLTLGNRMTQFRLDPANPNALEPGKRPRVTPHAVIVFKDGKFWMSYSTPGDDMQPQALIQVFLNVTVFGMDIQEAIDAPRFRTMSMPASFAPHEAYPGTLYLEADLYAQAAQGLTELGYTPVEYPNWDNQFGAVGAILRGDGVLLAGSDPREETWAAGK